MIILVDMDDTIENLTEAWINYANRRFGTAVNAADVTAWDPSEAFPSVSHEEMYALLLEDELYETVEPLEGAAFYLQKLISDGHEVFIVTNSPYQVMKAKMEKILFRHFPFIGWRQVIITGSKQLIRGDVLIDDGVHNLQGGGYAKLLFTAPHNRSFDAEGNGMVRVDCWEKVYEVINRHDNNNQDTKTSVTYELMDVLKNVKFGTQLTSTEIQQMVHKKFNRNLNSILPSDYCYNRLNNGINFEKHPHLFEYTPDNLYTYLGIDFPYNGKIYHKPRNGVEICVGEMINGKIKSEFGKSDETAAAFQSAESIAHKTKREPGLQLRFKVLKRDNFKCCSCGASPAKDPSVELHIDHITPWSKGGETVIDNLQTLCSRCNIGKSDIV